MELSYLFSAIRRRWWLVVLLSILGAVGGYFANGKKVETYQARALVNPIPSKPPRLPTPTSTPTSPTSRRERPSNRVRLSQRSPSN